MALLPKIGYGSSKREAGKYNRLFVYNMSEEQKELSFLRP